MALYSIESEQFLGMSHSGAVTVNGESAVELSDEEVDILVKLIQENDSTDVEDLDLENLYPDIYEKLDEAYHDMAFHAEYMHWLWEGYENGYYEYDEDELMDYCERELDFTFEYDEDDNLDDDAELDVDPELNDDDDDDEQYYAKLRAFRSWLDDYLHSLSDDEALSFMNEHMDACIEDEEVEEYTVSIPEAIIQKAKE